MAQLSAWGLSGTVATQDPSLESDAVDVVMDLIARFGAAANRFATNSEISLINDADGGTFDVSADLALILNAASLSDEISHGLYDITVLAALEAHGYDQDYELIRDREAVTRPAAPAPGRAAWSFDDASRQLTVSPGTRLDFGGCAKSLLVDVAVNALVARGGALVELGGDVAARGRGPNGPWVVGLLTTWQIRGDEPRVAVTDAGVATSSSDVRTWMSDQGRANHVIDPRTGECAHGLYCVATVAAPSCVEANALATAALLAEDADYLIAQHGASARLGRRDGEFVYVGGWPEENAA